MSRRGRSVLSTLFATALLATITAIATPPTADGWRQFGRTATHLNNAPGETAFTQATVPTLSVQGGADFGHHASSPGGAAVVKGVAYIGGSKGVLSAFSVPDCVDGTCTRLWRGVTHNGIYGTPAVAQGLVLIGSADRHLYAYPAKGCDSPTCDPVWRGQLHDAALASVSVADGVAYIGDFGGRVYAFDVAGCGKRLCSPLWTGHAGSNLEFNTTPAIAGGHLYVGALYNTPDDLSGRMLVFAADGCGEPLCRPEWRADALGPVDGTMSPLILGDTVFVGSGTRFSDQPNGTLHLLAFDADGCGARVCEPIRSYETGDSDLTGGLAVSGDVLYAGSQSTPDPNTVGVVTAFPADGCGEDVCDPLWIGINFASGFESPPVVAGDVVFVAKGPASGFPVDEAVLAYPADGCGTPTCEPIAFVSVGTEQFYLGASIAIADHHVFVPTEATATGLDTLQILGVEAAASNIPLEPM